MKRLLLCSMATVWLSIAVLSQCTEFTVFQTKGEVTMSQGTTSMAVQKNMKPGENSVLKIGQGSYAVLLSGNDKALRLIKPGSYAFADLQSMCRKSQTSLTREYMNYVAQSIIEKEEPKTAMVIKGAVYRSRTEFERTDMILPSDSSVISADKVTFAWHTSPAKKSRYLHIYENGVKNIYSRLLSDTTMSLPSFLFKPQTIYFWLVSNSPDPSDKEVRFTFIHGDKEWKKEFLEDENVMAELEREMQKTKKKIEQEKSKNTVVKPDTLKVK